MKEVLLVFTGGGLGAVARYLINRFAGSASQVFPWATLTANVLSCLILGLIIGWLADKNGPNQLIWLLVVTGFCGGMSTFSTFTAESMALYKDGLVWLLLVNITGNFILCAGAVSMGVYLSRIFL